MPICEFFSQLDKKQTFFVLSKRGNESLDIESSRYVKQRIQWRVHKIIHSREFNVQILYLNGNE